MSGKHADRAAERRRILRAIGRDEPGSDCDGTEDAGSTVDAGARTDGTASVDGSDGQQSFANGGAAGTSAANAAVLDPAEGDAGE